MNQIKSTKLSNMELQQIIGGKINWGYVTGYAAGSFTLGLFGGLPGALISGACGIGIGIIDELWLWMLYIKNYLSL